MKTILIFIVVFILLSSFACTRSSEVDGADWPQWGGPNRNWISTESGFDPQAFAEGVDILWEIDVGRGRSSVVISDGWLYTLGKLENEIVAFCINVKSGKARWTVLIQSDNRGEPQSTPAVDGDRVYTLSPAGDAHCLAVKNGETIWAVNIMDTYDVRRPSYGIASSPIVHNDIVLIHANNVVIAFDKMNGNEVWAHRDGDELTTYKSYSTPFPVRIGETTYLIRQGQARLEAFEIETGMLVASVEVRKPGSMVNNIDDGFVNGSRILMSGIALKSEMFIFDGNEFRSEWVSDDFKVDITPFMFVDGYLYGFEENSSLKSLGFVCIDASNGREIWREDLPYGSATFVDDIYFLLTKKGMLITADLSAAGYNELSRGELPSGSSYWSPAVVSGGRLYAKSWQGEIYCVDAAVK